MIIQALLGVLILASLVVAYLSAKTWHWAHVLLVLGVFLAAVGYLVLAAETLRINAVWRAQVAQLEQQIADTKLRIDALQEGTDNGQLIGALAADEVKIPEEAESIPSLADLDHQLHLETRLRGTVWRDVKPAAVDPQKREVRAVVETPNPPGVRTDSILFVFEQGEPALPDPTQGAQFLGEFRVTAAAGQEVTMTPVLPMDDFEWKRLAGSQKPWSLYEVMPVDRYSIFAGKSEEELRKLLPEQSVEEYLRHGKEAEAGDDEWHRVGFDEAGKPLGPNDLDKAKRVEYRRRLRDYTVEFEALARQRVLLLADMAATIQDNERLAVALASAKELESFRTEEIRKLRIDLAGVVKERETIEKHLAVVETQLANARRLLDETLRENARLAARLAAQQEEWKASIETEPDSASEEPADAPLAAAAAG